MINEEKFLNVIMNEDYFITLFQTRRILSYFESNIFYDVDNVILNATNQDSRNNQFCSLLKLKLYNVKLPRYNQNEDIEQLYFNCIVHEFQNQLRTN